MILSHADKSPPPLIDRGVGVEAVGRGGERFSRPTRRQAVKPLIGEVGKVDHAARHRIGRTAILVDSGPDVRVRRGHVGDPPIATPLDDDVSAAFLGPAFQPVNILGIHDDLAKTERCRSDSLCTERRRPCTVGCGCDGHGY